MSAAQSRATNARAAGAFDQSVFVRATSGSWRATTRKRSAAPAGAPSRRERWCSGDASVLRYMISAWPRFASPKSASKPSSSPRSLR